MIEFLASLKPADWVIVTATLLGPILAVQAQKFVEGVRLHREAKLRVFTTLMATRTARLSSSHVEALNMIDVSFYGRVVFGQRKQSRTELAVVRKWAEYVDSLTPHASFTDERSFERRYELFIDLLAAMAADLDFDFDRVTIKKHGYSPMAHGDLERDQTAIRDGVLKILDGRSRLKVAMSIEPPPGATQQPAPSSNSG